MFRQLDHDPDDPPPIPTWTDACWHVANRTAENLLRALRSWGWL